MSQGPEGVDPEVLELARGEARDCLQRIEANVLALEAGGADPDAVDSIFRDAHSIKGNAGMVGWDEAAEIAHAIEDRLDEVRRAGVFPPELADPLLRATDALREAVEGGQGVAGEAIAALGGDATSGPEGEAPAAPAPEPAPRDTGGEQRTMRVPASKVDRMLDAVGETILHHRRLEHLLAGRLDDPAEEEMDSGHRLLEEFQDAVIEMRTLPLDSITAPFPRAVRDLAVKEGKEVELVMRGTQTQLDRLILDGIGDAISHVLRNAVAHGIEPPEQREAAGKPLRGVVELRAEQRAGMVAIEVADDGAGVPRELLARVEESGSLVDVLATPGLTTATEVSGIAGRGVGLDAVKEDVEGLGGSLEVHSEPGRGTVVTMLLPLTLALLHVLLCERGTQPFGIPMGSVTEVVTAKGTMTLEGRPAIELRGERVEVGDVARMLGADAPELDRGAPAIAVASAGRRVAVACDLVIGDQDVVVKTLGPLLAAVGGYLGAAILGDGRVALILDPNHLVRMPVGAPRAPRRPIVQPERPVAPKVLVVDDQFTVRELQRSILETAGYRVELARDGLEALERLAEDDEIDLVLTDILMPQMSGLELLERIREEGATASLPVVMVTSVGAPEDRQRGMEAGADAYIVKDEFDQQALLETIERLIGR